MANPYKQVDNIRVGDKLPRVIPVRTGTVLPSGVRINSEQTVLSVDLDLDDLNFLMITTDYGRWRFHRSETVAFPRRADGSTRLWTPERDPRVNELCVGDMVPNPKLLHPNTEPGWNLLSDDLRQAEIRDWVFNTGLRVYRVSLRAYPDAAGRDLEVYFVDRNLDPAIRRAARRYLARADYRFSELGTPIDRDRDISEDPLAQLDYVGPYRWRTDTEQLGSQFYFVVRRGVRGRWPTLFPTFDDVKNLASNQYQVRGSKDLPWSELMLLAGVEPYYLDSVRIIRRAENASEPLNRIYTYVPINAQLSN